MKSSKDEWGRRGGEGEGKVGAQVGSLQRIHFPFHFFARVLITSDGVKQSFEQTFFRRGQVKKKKEEEEEEEEEEGRKAVMPLAPPIVSTFKFRP